MIVDVSLKYFSVQCDILKYFDGKLSVEVLSSQSWKERRGRVGRWLMREFKKR